METITNKIIEKIEENRNKITPENSIYSMIHERYFQVIKS
jgi:hypothetical protein